MNRQLIALTTAFLLLLAGCGTETEPPAQPEPTAPQASQAEDAAPPEGEAESRPEEPAVSQAATHGALAQRPTGDVIEIKERLFIAQTNDIYLNYEDYLGKTIRYEGMYFTEVWQDLESSEEIHYVIRYGPGCCGTDGNAGFEIAWPGEYPQDNDWVEVEGVLEKIEIEGGYYLRLNVFSLAVKQERGAEFVST